MIIELRNQANHPLSTQTDLNIDDRVELGELVFSCEANSMQEALQLAQANGKNLHNLYIPKSELTNAYFEHLDLTNSSLVESNFTNATFNNCIFKNCIFSSSDFTNATFNECDLDGAFFAGATGNGKEIQSLVCGPYSVVKSPTNFAVGCYEFPILEWKEIVESNDFSVFKTHFQQSNWDKYGPCVVELLYS